jgi:hypothetical protein
MTIAAMTGPTPKISGCDRRVAVVAPNGEICAFELGLALDALSDGCPQPG